MIKGVDFSHWQSKVDFAKLVANGIEFAIFKAGEIPTKSKMEFLDDMYHRNIREAKAHGIISGAYFFFHPAIGASRQARHFLNIMMMCDKPDLPPVIDVEVTDNMKPNDCAAVLWAMIHGIEQGTGRKPIIYTRNGIWVNQYGNPDWGSEYLFWLAQYNVSLTHQDPKIKKNVIMWQHTDRLKLPGIGVALDGNYWLKSEAELYELAGIKEPASEQQPKPPIKTDPYKRAWVIWKRLMGRENDPFFGMRRNRY